MEEHDFDRPPDPLTHPIFAITPVDDSGSPTQSRFGFQHHCTARIVFAMLPVGSIELVVCETHEDATVVYEDATVELVSVRHCDDQTLPLPALRDAVVGLFRRWQRTGRIARCRLMSNGKPVAGREKAQGLIDCCHNGDPAPWVDRVRTWTYSDDSDEIANFLLGFSVDEPTGAREHIVAINCQSVVTPALESVGLVHLDATTAYHRVVRLVERCNRDEPVNRTAMLDYLADPNRASATSNHARRIGRRAIDRTRLRGVLLEPLVPEPIVQLSFDDQPEEDSTLARKLELGGFGPTTVNAARLLRANWEATETRWRSGAPGGDPLFSDLRMRALAAAAHAERLTMGPNAYGPAMHEQLEQTFTTANLDRKPPFELDDQLLLGLVYELTDECRVWWSPQQEL